MVLESDLDIAHAVPPAFIKHLTMTSECAKGNFIQWVSVDVLHKNNSTRILFLDLGTEYLNQKFSTFARNLDWYFYFSLLKFEFYYHALKLFSKVRLGVEDDEVCPKLDNSNLIIDLNLTGGDKILQGAVSTEVFVYLD